MAGDFIKQYYTNIQTVKLQNKMEVTQSILDKIKKLKALMDGAAKINSVGESEAAALKLNELLTKYNLSLLDVEQSGDDPAPSAVEIERSPAVNVRSPYGALWKQCLLFVLAGHYFCRMIGVAGSGGKVLLLGTAVNTATAIDLYNTLQSVYLHAAKTAYGQNKPYLKGGQLTKRFEHEYIVSYLLGCTHGLRTKLDDARSRECTAVAICHNRHIDRYIAEKMKIKPASTELKPKTTVSPAAYSNGYRKGRNTELQKSLDF
jgi:hypothetical protein